MAKAAKKKTTKNKKSARVSAKPQAATRSAKPAKKQAAKWKDTAQRYQSEPETNEGRDQLAARAKDAEKKRDRSLAAYHQYEFACRDARLVDFQVSSVTGGIDALGDVTLRLDIDGVHVNGRGVSTDVVEASARAYLSAVNRALRRKGMSRAVQPEPAP